MGKNSNKKGYNNNHNQNNNGNNNNNNNNHNQNQNQNSNKHNHNKNKSNNNNNSNNNHNNQNKHNNKNNNNNNQQKKEGLFRPFNNYDDSIKPCSYYLSNGRCDAFNNNTCRFSHFIKLNDLRPPNNNHRAITGLGSLDDDNGNWTHTLFAFDRTFGWQTAQQGQCQTHPTLMDGPIDDLRTANTPSGGWAFIACHAVVPGVTAVDVGKLCAFALDNNQGWYLPRDSEIAHKTRITAMDVYTEPDNEAIVVTGSEDGTLRLWRNCNNSNDNPEFDHIEIAESHLRAVTAIRIVADISTGDGTTVSRIYTGSNDRTVNVYSDDGYCVLSTLLPPSSVSTSSSFFSSSSSSSSSSSLFSGKLSQAAVQAASSTAHGGEGYEIVAIDTTELSYSTNDNDEERALYLFVGCKNGSIRTYTLSNPDKPELITNPSYLVPPESHVLSNAKNNQYFQPQLTAMVTMNVNDEEEVLITGYSDGRIIIRNINNGIVLPSMIIANDTGNYQPQHNNNQNQQHNKKPTGHKEAITRIVVLNGLQFCTGGKDGRLFTWEFTI